MQAYHTLVAGDSGGGKTTYLREAHDTYPGLSIWIDHSDDGVDGIGLRDASLCGVVEHCLSGFGFVGSAASAAVDDDAHAFERVGRTHESTGSGRGSREPGTVAAENGRHMGSL